MVSLEVPSENPRTSRRAPSEDCDIAFSHDDPTLMWKDRTTDCVDLKVKFAMKVSKPKKKNYLFRKFSQNSTHQHRSAARFCSEPVFCVRNISAAHGEKWRLKTFASEQLRKFLGNSTEIDQTQFKIDKETVFLNFSAVACRISCSSSSCRRT